MEDRYNVEGDSVDPLDPEEAERQDVLRRALDCLPAPVAQPPATAPVTEPVAATAPVTALAAPATVVAEAPRRTIPLSRSFVSKLRIWWHRSSTLDKFFVLFPLAYGFAFMLATRFMPLEYAHGEGVLPKTVRFIATLGGIVAFADLLIAIFISWPRRYKNTDEGFVQENADVAAALFEWIEEYRRLERELAMPWGTGNVDRQRKRAVSNRTEELLVGIRFYALLLSTDAHLQPVHAFLFQIDEARRIKKLRNKSPLYENRE